MFPSHAPTAACMGPLEEYCLHAFLLQRATAISDGAAS